MKPQAMLTGAALLLLGVKLGSRLGRRTAYLQGVEATTRYMMV